MAEFSFSLKSIRDLFSPSTPNLPEADAEMVLEADRAYAAVGASSGSSGDQHDAARFRLAWALAHSTRGGDAARAVVLLEEEGAHKWGSTVLARDRRYITAVAHFNDGDYLAARAAAEEALRRDAGCRQAEQLMAAAEDRIAKDGLIGIGAVGVGAAVLGGIVTALAASGRRR